MIQELPIPPLYDVKQRVCDVFNVLIAATLESCQIPLAQAVMLKSGSNLLNNAIKVADVRTLDDILDVMRVCITVMEEEYTSPEEYIDALGEIHSGVAALAKKK